MLTLHHRFACLGLVAASLLMIPTALSAQDGAAEKLSFVYASKRFTNSELCYRTLTGEGFVRRTQNNRWTMEPAVSPQGDRIAYVTYRNNAPRLCVANIDMSEERELIQNFDARTPAWSPDGASLVFTGFFNGNYEILGVSTDGTNFRQLTQDANFDSDPCWSPDGKTIAFTSNRTGAFRLYTMSTDGSNLRDLLGVDLIACVYPNYSPDGKTIAFGGRGGNDVVQVFTVNADGGDLKQLTPDGKRLCSYPTWSPDGKYIAYVRFDHWANSTSPGTNPVDDLAGGDIMLYDIETKKHTQLTSAEGPLWGPRPAWIPIVKSAGN